MAFIINHKTLRLMPVKFSILIALILCLGIGCKKSTPYPSIKYLSPQRYSTYHSGDTIPITVSFTKWKSTGILFIDAYILRGNSLSFIIEKTIPITNMQIDSTYIVINTTVLDTIVLDASPTPTTLDYGGPTIYVLPK